MGGALALTGGEGLEPAEGDASVPTHLHTSPAFTGRFLKRRGKGRRKKRQDRFF